MSATNRGAERNKDDYYITPKWLVEDFLKAFTADQPHFNPQLIVDPCAGGDAVNDMPYPEVLKTFFRQARFVTYDIRQDSRAIFKVDYLKHQSQFAPDLIMSNPPFVLAEEFIKKSLADLTGNGTLIFLLRINFLGSQKRLPFFKDFLPHYCYVSSKRPSFKKGPTDATEYAHFVWMKSLQKAKWCQTRVI